MTAIPSAPPSSRDRSFIAEATPCCADGSALVMAEVAGVIASPMPIAERQQTGEDQPVRAAGVELGEHTETDGDQQQTR